jgi:ankyrin repeat protein
MPPIWQAFSLFLLLSDVLHFVTPIDFLVLLDLRSRSQGRIEVASLLINRGAQVNVKDKGGGTALHW